MFLQLCHRGNNGKLFWELAFAVRQDVFPRDDVRYLLERGWESLRSLGQDYLLIPVGVSLAWSYCLDDRDEDAVTLLKGIWYAQTLTLRPRKGASATTMHGIMIQRPAAFWPVSKLLQELSPQPNFQDRDLDYQRLLFVKIRRNAVSLRPTPVDIPSSRVLFAERVAIVKMDEYSCAKRPSDKPFIDSELPIGFDGAKQAMN